MASFHRATYRIIRKSHETWWITIEQTRAIFSGELESAGNSDRNLCLSSETIWNIHLYASDTVEDIQYVCAGVSVTFTDLCLVSSNGQGRYRILSFFSCCCHLRSKSKTAGSSETFNPVILLACRSPKVKLLTGRFSLHSCRKKSSPSAALQWVQSVTEGVH